MRRLLAVVAAAAMVAGSIAIRSRLDRREEDRTNPLRVVCAAELAPACDALRRTSAQVTVEPAPATADRLGRDETPEIDGWLVPAPWPQIVDGRRMADGLLPLFDDVTAPLARSPLVIVVSKTVRCEGNLGWKCLGDLAARGQAKPGHPDPREDGLGTLILGDATAAYFGRADLARDDLDDPAFERWFRAVENATPRSFSGGSRLEEMLATGTAIYDAVGTIEAEAAPVLQRSAPAVRDRVMLLYPEPMATVDVVLAGSGSRLRGVAGGDNIRKALAEAGWRVDGRSAAGGQLPASNGLPSPGFLDAVRSRAEEVRR